MTRFLLICLAGGIGSGTRYLVNLGAGKLFGTDFPYGTLIVNLVGCFLIAAVAQVAVTTTLISPTLRLTLTTGFIGGLTTYSAFNYETTTLFQEGAWLTGAINAAVTTLGCLASGLLGFWIAGKVFAAT